MFISTGSIISHGHNEWIVVLVIIIKGIKKDSQSIPIVIGAKNRSFKSFTLSIPESLKKYISMVIQIKYPVANNIVS